MILGYASIIISIAIVITLTLIKVKNGYYYAGIYVVGALMLLSSSLANSELVGSDIHLEFYYANQALMNGWDSALTCTVNSCLPITILAPAISKALNIDLIWVFKVIYPLLFALVPVLLVWIYSRFISTRLAFLSAFFFIAVPTFFMELPAVTRQMFAEILIVSMIALMLSRVKYKLWIMIPVSFLIVASHYSSAAFWFLILGGAFASYTITHKEIQATQCIVVLGLTALFFAFYSHWVSSGWIMVDTGNAITRAITQPVNNYWLTIPAGLVLAYGIYKMLRSDLIPGLYKGWVILCSVMLLAAMVYPAIAATINFTRYYHLVLIILAPALVFTFYNHPKVIMPLLLVIFFVTSGLAFKVVGYDSIEKVYIPYSIALENKSLDAGNYLTADDRIVAKWASENGIDEVYGDMGGSLALQDYYDIFHAHPLGDTIPDGYIFLRSWNTEHKTLARWVGPGMRRQIPLPELNREVIYQSGNSILLGVK